MERHGFSGKNRAPEYLAWVDMKRRCCNAESSDYKAYGGRGIKVHPAWQSSFLAFYRHIGPRPSARHSLDRYPNNDGNYEPGNVRWATSAEQNRNHRANVWIEFQGQRKIMADWAREFDIDQHMLRYWIVKRNFTMHQALERMM